MTTEDGGITSVECPECSDNVDVTLPWSANIVSIIVQPQTKEHDLDRTAIERPREHQTSCVNGHILSILYDW
ncbi:hypothetical protein [Halapricum desulfuricans]